MMLIPCIKIYEGEVSYKKAEEEVAIYLLKRDIKNLKDFEQINASCEGKYAALSLIHPPFLLKSQVTEELERMKSYEDGMEGVTDTSILGCKQAAIQVALNVWSKCFQSTDKGIAIFTGALLQPDRVVKYSHLVCLPLKEVTTKVCYLGKEFKTDELEDQIVEDKMTIGFIVMGKFHSEIGILRGINLSTIQILHRVRMGMQDSVAREVAKLATESFINPATQLPTVTRLVVAGYNNIHVSMMGCGLFHEQMRGITESIIDVEYFCGIRGAIEELATDPLLLNCKFLRDETLLDRFFKEVQKEEKKYVVGVNDTLESLSKNNLETLIVSEGIEIYIASSILSETDKAKGRSFVHVDNPLGVTDAISLFDFLKKRDLYYRKVVIVSSNAEAGLGYQFLKTYHGVGGILFEAQHMDSNKVHDQDDEDAFDEDAFDEDD